MNQRNAVGRSFRFDCPPFNADQWVQELIGFVPVGAVEFVAGSPFIHVNGSAVFPEGHQGIISHIRVTMVDTFGLSTARDHTWTLKRNGSPVPGFKQRALEGDLNYVPSQLAQVDLVSTETLTAALVTSQTLTASLVTAQTLTAALVTGGTINGILAGFPSAVCPIGCDYLLTNLVGGLGLAQAGTITGTASIPGTITGTAAIPGTITGTASIVGTITGASVTDSHIEQRQGSGLPGVLVPVWMSPGDQFSLEVTAGQLSVSACASVGGAIWPVPSDAASGAE